MRLKKEDVYVSLKDKSKEELTDLWEFLDNAGEKQYDDKENFINDNYYNTLFPDEDNIWCLCLETSYMLEDKKEVTIEQLKEILKPNLQTQLESAKKEVKRIENLIMEENEPKIGDWCKFWDNDKSNVCISKLWYICYNTVEYKYHSPESHYKNCEKITNPELIKLLENESK